MNIITRTFSVLKAFTDIKSEWGVSELSRHLKIPVSSVHRILKALKEENLLKFSIETERYEIGEEFIRISSIVSKKSNIKKVTRPYLESLSSKIKQPVYLAQYYTQYQKIAFIDSVRSSSALQYVLNIGVLQPIHIAASGKCVLSFLEEEVINEIIKENIEETKREEILLELEEIRKKKYAITSNERKQGAFSVGAPLFDASKKVIGSIICVLPLSEYDEENQDRYIKEVKSTSEKISYLLGYME